MSQGWTATPSLNPCRWRTCRSHYWPACWAGSASWVWRWLCCWGAPASSVARWAVAADRRKMVKTPPPSRESVDTHFDELHHEYNNLFNKILRALLLHYINHTTPLHGSGAPPFSRSSIQLLKLLMSFTSLAN